jgi:hypothetical protein
VNNVQRQAFKKAASKLDPKSRFYADDLAALRAHYGKRPAAECRDSVARLSHRVSQAEFNRHCQTGGMF